MGFSKLRRTSGTLKDRVRKEMILKLRMKEAAEFISDPARTETRPGSNIRDLPKDPKRKIGPAAYLAGSDEQRLDVCNSGPYRGDDIIHSHGFVNENPDYAIEDEDLMMLNYHMDLAEDGREGSDLSGDEHSSGLQGGDNELSEIDGEGIFFYDEGLPGDEEKNQDEIVDFEEKRRLV